MTKLLTAVEKKKLAAAKKKLTAAKKTFATCLVGAKKAKTKAAWKKHVSKAGAAWDAEVRAVKALAKLETALRAKIKVRRKALALKTAKKKVKTAKKAVKKKTAAKKKKPSKTAVKKARAVLRAAKK